MNVKFLRHDQPLEHRWSVGYAREMKEFNSAIAQKEATLEGLSVERLYELAGVKLSGGDIEGAIAAYSRCHTLEPRNAAVCNNLGAALIKAGRFDAAAAALENALELRPGYHRALVNLGKALRELGRLDEASARLRQALAVEPNYVPALINLGDTLTAMGAPDAARQALERAVAIAPRSVEALTSLGIVRLQTGDVPESLDALHAAVSLAPDHPDAHANLAHALFCSGDWQASWPHFEYRFRRASHRSNTPPPAGVPRWDGIFSGDLELCLWGEQGLGDQLQFVRYAKLLHADGVRCIVACDPRLVRLLSLADLGSTVVPFGSAAATPAMRWIPLMSLPEWHRTDPATVPLPQGYLAAEPSRIDRWRRRLSGAHGLRVALAWAGNPKMETGRYIGRSPPLDALAPLMSVPNVSFVSLQKGAGEEQIDAVPFRDSLLRLTDLDLGSDAFLDTAAILKCVDLLVTSDTAIAHLAGALAVPTWLCLMHEPDWRWMRRGDGTPWYTSMRLFRQPAPGDWASVYVGVADALRQLVIEN